MGVSTRSRQPFSGWPSKTDRTVPVCLVDVVDLGPLVYQVDRIYSVCLVYPLSLAQPNKRDKPHQPDRSDSGLLMRAGLFSILRDHFSEVFDRATEGILELYLRFPIQERARPADVGPSDFWIIGGQRMMGDMAR